MSPGCSRTPVEYRCRPGRALRRFGYAIEAERFVHLGRPVPRIAVRVWANYGPFEGTRLTILRKLSLGSHAPDRMRSAIAYQLWQMRRLVRTEARIVAGMR